MKGVPTVPAVSREPPKVAQEQPTAAAAEQVSDGLKIALSPKRKVVPVPCKENYPTIQATETEKEGGWEGDVKQAPAKVVPNNRFSSNDGFLLHYLPVPFQPSEVIFTPPASRLRLLMAL